MKKKSFKMNKKIIGIVVAFIVGCIYIISSYKGFFILEEGFNQLDYLILNILGDSILVGLVTYLSTKSISLYISKKEFERNNKISVSINEKSKKIYNYAEFLKSYNKSNLYFCLSTEDREIVEYVYKRYQVFESIFDKNSLNNKQLQNILNFPFVSRLIVFEKSFTKWENLINDTQKTSDVKLLNTILNDKDYENFEKFSNILNKIKYFEIVNLNSVQSCVLLITAEGRVVNKISCLPNTTYEIYMYFKEEKWVQFIGFKKNYEGEEEAEKIMGFRYSNKLGDTKPAQITLDDYIKIE